MSGAVQENPAMMKQSLDMMCGMSPEQLDAAACAAGVPAGAATPARLAEMQRQVRGGPAACKTKTGIWSRRRAVVRLHPVRKGFQLQCRGVHTCWGAFLGQRQLPRQKA